MSESLERTNIRLNDQNKALQLKITQMKQALTASRDFVVRVRENYNPRIGSYILPLIEAALAEVDR